MTLKAANLGKSFRKELARESFLDGFRVFLASGGKTEKKTALKNFSLEASRSEIIAVTGDNGAGKTTLLRILAGTLTPDSGEISFEGKKAALLGFDSIMNDRLSVYENALAALAIFGSRIHPLKKAADSLLKEAELTELRNSPLYKLSAGMKIRIPFLSALNSGGDLYLIDEMISVGDEKFRAKCLEKIKALKREGAVIIFSTHERALVDGLADYELRLNRGKTEYFRKTARPGGAVGASGDLFLNSVKRSSALLGKLRQAGYVLKEAPPASREDLLLVHEESWVTRIERNDLSPEEEKKYSLPRSREILAHSYRLAGAAVAASENALSCGLGLHPLGGAHHAFPGHGEGFCPVNDCAIAVKKLLLEGKIKRPVIVDLDAHQGNGTAFIFDGSAVKTYSIHCAEGYPYDRVRSFTDVDLPDGAGDEEYLSRLGLTLPAFLENAKPDFCFLIASSDLLRGDPVGRLGLTPEGVLKRDETALKQLSESGVKVCLSIPGGYGDPENHAAVNFGTVRAAAGFYPSFNKIVHI